MSSTSAPRCSTPTGRRWRKRGKKARNALHQLHTTVHNTQWITAHFHLIFAGVPQRRRDPAPALAVVHRHDRHDLSPALDQTGHRPVVRRQRRGPGLWASRGVCSWPLQSLGHAIAFDDRTQKCLELGHRVWRQRRGRGPQSTRLNGRLVASGETQDGVMHRGHRLVLGRADTCRRYPWDRAHDP